MFYLGPGNNGLDGLVAARYLSQMNYNTPKVILLSSMKFSQKNDPTLMNNTKTFIELARNFGVQIVQYTQSPGTVQENVAQTGDLLHDSTERASISQIGNLLDEFQHASFIVDAIFGRNNPAIF